MTRRALLVGCSYSAAPLFFALKARGLHVTVCGNEADAPCHAYADASVFIDYSDRERLLATAAEGRFDYLVPTCNDFSYLSCAWVAEQLQFPGYDAHEVALTIHTKARFREFTSRHAIPAPRAVETGADDPFDPACVRFPVLVKPVDSFSGRGVTRLPDAHGLSSAIAAAAQASRSGRVLVEEFLGGNLHSHSAFIRDERILFDAFVDEYCSVYPYQVDCSNHPSVLGETPRRAVRKAVTDMVRALHLRDGLLHTQFLEEGGRIWIIESMRRCPGDLYGTLVTESAGIAYNDLCVRPYVGEALPASIAAGPPRLMGRHTISTREPAIPFSFSHRIPCRAARIVPLKGSGLPLRAAPYDKLAILFVEYDNEQDMRSLTPALAAHVSIQPVPSA